MSNDNFLVSYLPSSIETIANFGLLNFLKQVVYLYPLQVILSLLRSDWETKYYIIKWVRFGQATLFQYFISKEENVGIYQRYIANMSRIGNGRHDISWRKIGGEIFPQILPKYRRYIEDKSLIFWRYFPSFMQRDLTAQITPVLIRRPRCDSNGNMAIQLPDCSQFFIQWPKLICNGKLTFQRLFWPKFIL